MYDLHKLIDACESGDVVTVQACIARGVNINTKNYYARTPLISAVEHNQLEIVRILLARDDLDMADTNQYGSTALYYACGRGFADCVALLGQDRRMTRQIINMKNTLGNTALMGAVSYGDLSCVEEMAKLNGVDWETKNGKGKSLEDVARSRYNKNILDVGVSRNNEDIFKYLKKRKFGLAIIARSEKFKEIAGNIQVLDENLKVDNKVLILKQAKEKEELDQKQEKDRTVFDEKQTKELEEFTKKLEEEKMTFSEHQGQAKNDMVEKHKTETSKLNDGYNLNMKCLEEAMHTHCTAPKPAATPPTPDCPVCLESMPPPTQIFNCPNGHLECGPCKEKVTKCSICKEPVMGRATAMEQMLRTLYGVS